MKLLYIFPHPDDESFGPAAAIHGQIKKGHQVFLLTLTKGGATGQRHRLGFSVAEMGEVRYREMLKVEKLLGLTGMVVLDFPDSGLKELDPRILEREIKKHISQIQPNIVITYPVHGISGFHDHLVTHAVVKRTFLAMRDSGAAYLRRLAFFTLPDSGAPVWMEDGFPRLKHTEEALIDCKIELEETGIAAMKNALHCYGTYQEIIEKTKVMEKIGDRVYFEIWNENFSPVLADLTEKIGYSPKKSAAGP